MRVLIAAGGTGGHINPALSIAECLKKRHSDIEILFAGSPRGMEATLIPKAGYPFAPIKVRGFQRQISLENLMLNLDAVKCLAFAGHRAKVIIKKFQPDLVLGTGGYVSGPVVRCAARMGIPTAIHEQNAYPGVTNKILSKIVDLVFLPVVEAKKYFPAEATGKMHVVGNPVREGILLKIGTEARRELGIGEKMCILSYGGSLGADAVNRIGADVMEWRQGKKDVYQIHAYGRLGKDLMPKLLEERSIRPEDDANLDLREYIDNMDTCMAAADLVICRSGASTLSELEAAGKASILIPSPNVAENHQYHNAMVLASHEAAVVIEEKNYNKQQLFDLLDGFYNDRNRLVSFGKNASKLAIFDTADRICDGLERLLQRR
ncbi:MAG TPA: UDP-N-acetylglucosamine--N-acetylmuramyl-(pentapeptide) pyrophosphoryl-undecaprenol N-acetylglucosamine transferase [Firmicutes bacterium]|nr:UDP-N-acetylglucosamine--N-acetylmuramyl-(pentapeptide) pyrophosphoryl-undecaprenol N-acetylglucosamine transferase [Bacillota bacterium]